MEEEVHTLFIIMASNEYRSECIAVYGRDEEHACEKAHDWLAVRRRALPHVNTLACPGGFVFDPRAVQPSSGVLSFAGQYTRELAEGTGRVRP